MLSICTVHPKGGKKISMTQWQSYFHLHTFYHLYINTVKLLCARCVIISVLGFRYLPVQGIVKLHRVEETHYKMSTNLKHHTLH